MIQRLSVLLTLFCGLSFGHNGHVHHHEHHRAMVEEDLTAEEIIYCNATEMGEKDMAEASRVFNEWLATNGDRKLQSEAPVEVPVYFHVLTGSNGMEGSVTMATIDSQMDVLNESFQPYFTFDLVDVDVVDNDEWFEGGLSFQSTTARTQLRSSLRKGGSGSLNIYSTETTRSGGGTLLGLATFPSEYTSEPDQDGVVIWYGTLPGGSCGFRCNRGYTLVHEVGHWLGLYHTFHHFTTDGCVEGDDVDDTPRQAQPTSGCPFFTPDTCPTFTGRDPIENFMDYSSDTCKDSASGDGFSPGQIQRMRGFWDVYRAGDVVVPASTPAEMTPPSENAETVDVYIEFQYDRFDFETSWEIKNSAGKTVLSYPSGSARGLLSGTLSFPPDTYTIRIQDSAGDGTCCNYGLGYVLVAVSGGPVVGGYGIFRSFATVTFVVPPASGAFVGGETVGAPGSFKVPDQAESAMVADQEPTGGQPPTISGALLETRLFSLLSLGVLILSGYV